MTAIAFDTHETVKYFIAAGFSEPQAEAVTKKISEIGEHQSASKADIQYIRQDIKELDHNLRQDIKGLDGNWRVEIEKTKSEMLRWYIGIAIIQSFAMLGGIITLAKIIQP